MVPQLANGDHYEELFSSTGALHEIWDGKYRLKHLTYMDSIVKESPLCNVDPEHSSLYCEDKSRYQVAVYERWKRTDVGNARQLPCGASEKITTLDFTEVTQQTIEEKSSRLQETMQRESSYVKDKGWSQDFHVGATATAKKGGSTSASTGGDDDTLKTETKAEAGISATVELGYNWEEHEQETWKERSFDETITEFQNHITNNHQIKTTQGIEIEYTPSKSDNEVLWWDREQQHVIVKYDLWTPQTNRVLNTLTIEGGNSTYSAIDLSGPHSYVHSTSALDLPTDISKPNRISKTWECGNSEFSPTFEDHEPYKKSLIAHFRPSENNAQIIVTDYGVYPWDPIGLQKPIMLAVQGAKVKVEVPSFSTSQGNSACPQATSEAFTDEFGSASFYFLSPSDLNELSPSQVPTPDFSWSGDLTIKSGSLGIPFWEHVQTSPKFEHKYYASNYGDVASSSGNGGISLQVESVVGKFNQAFHFKPQKATTTSIDEEYLIDYVTMFGQFKLGMIVTSDVLSQVGLFIVERYDSVSGFLKAKNLEPFDGGIKVNSISEDISSFTVGLWIKPESDEAGTLVEWNKEQGTSDGVHLRVNYPTKDILYADIVDGGGTSHIIQASSPVGLSGGWHHVALSYDKGTGIARIYLDGVELIEKNLGSFDPQTSSNLFFGKRPLGPVEFLPGVHQVVQVQPVAGWAADIVKSNFFCRK